jgi:hypothetical protein
MMKILTIGMKVYVFYHQASNQFKIFMAFHRLARIHQFAVLAIDTNPDDRV